MSRLVRALAAALVALLGLTMIGSTAVPSAAAQSDDRTGGLAIVLQASGLLDPIVADFVEQGLDRAATDNARAVVLQINSRGSVLDTESFAQLATAIADAEVPVAVWVGPSGARALGDWVDLASLADRVGVAPGARIGELPDVSRLPADLQGRWGDNADQLRRDTFNDEQALAAGIATDPAPVLGEYLVSLSDYGIVAVGDNESDRTQVRFEALSLVDQQMHTVASPPVAYLLFVIGMALLVFEFYTAGVGVAGVVGAFMFLLGTFGLASLPVNVWAVALLVFSMFAFSVDVQTGVPRFWSGVGLLAFAIGTIWLYRNGVSMSWIPKVVGIVGIAMMMFTGMPTMVRTRFSTPTIGREYMLGQEGIVEDDVSPDGVVRIDGALWKARTNRATPVTKGGAVRVAAVEGLVLEVEPLEGAARDYRERGKDVDEIAADTQLGDPHDAAPNA